MQLFKHQWKKPKISINIIRIKEQRIYDYCLFLNSSALDEINGTRAKKALSTGDTTYYIGDHFEVANGEETKYIFAGNQRIAKVTTGNSYFYHKDHLGSSSVMTDYPDGLTGETTDCF